MTYKHELITRIKDLNKWPVFDRPDFLQELNTIGDDAFAKETMPSRILCNCIKREGVKTSPDLASRLFS